LNAPWHVAGQGEHEPHRFVAGVGGGAEHARAPALDHSQLVDGLSYHADLVGGQPGNELAFMPAYEAATSRVGTKSAPV
jgi:hypothetical protein